MLVLIAEESEIRALLIEGWNFKVVVAFLTGFFSDVPEKFDFFFNMLALTFSLFFEVTDSLSEWSSLATLARYSSFS